MAVKTFGKMFCIKCFYFLLSACLWLFNCHFQDHGIAKLIVVQGNDSFLLFKMLIRNSGIFADMITSLLNHRKFKLVWKNNRGFLFFNTSQCKFEITRVWFLEQGIWWYFPQVEFLVSYWNLLLPLGWPFPDKWLLIPSTELLFQPIFESSSSQYCQSWNRQFNEICKSKMLFCTRLKWRLLWKKGAFDYKEGNRGVARTPISARVLVTDW